MTAKRIDGNAISSSIRDGYRLRVEQLHALGITPGLTVIVVGDDPASALYVRNKARACQVIGIVSQVVALPATTTQNALVALIDTLNADRSVHGILVQLPLPAHIDDRAIIEAIAADKDVDGFHVANMGALVIDESRFPPCTPSGVMKMLEHEGIAVQGKHVVIVGRSNIVGKPQALLMLRAGATVTICHSKTVGLAEHTRRADILVAAVGRLHFITADMVKPGAVVIDVGINRDADGKLAGDVDFAAVALIAAAITPVPGGVGPMTITMLLGNTLAAAERVAAGPTNQP